MKQLFSRSMNFELSQSFYFEAAHSLNREMETESSRRIHGHTYVAQVTVSARPNGTSGMIMDLGIVRASVERVRGLLDHRFLDEVNDLGPPTLENLCVFIWHVFAEDLDGLISVRVGREASGDFCVLRYAEESRAVSNLHRTAGDRAGSKHRSVCSPDDLLQR